ncbi:proline--tRNA ligase [Buchnera aphidicola (Pemphigus obesinymphae)]|nr:proline--tRNA ligase [Buchnera aphidicola]MCW5196480.1 proline--tRNA ligase [Buchnera aphidicola (Pemphigus obesinymphae)]
MRANKYFFCTIKERPHNIDIISHQLMLRSGMIRKTASGIYTWLPTGLRVLKKIENIVREELNKIGAIEIFMPIIQPVHLWKISKRWNTYGKELLKVIDRHNITHILGPTHEEVITFLVKNEVHSYKQLPLILYQIQTKFRDEIRPRCGVMRSKEFIMKDAYSFHADITSLQTTYHKMHQTYTKIFQRMKLKFTDIKAKNGEMGGNISHEFHAFTNNGEDKNIYPDTLNNSHNIKKNYSIQNTIKSNNKEGKKSLDEHDCLNIERSIEIGHIFQLEQKYSKTINAYILENNGNKNFLNMGCYGIGITRIISAIIEQNHDNRGIIWNSSISPFQAVILPINFHKSNIVQEISEKIYLQLKEKNVETMLDDRNIHPGIMFTEMELIGIPHSIIVSERHIYNNEIEYISRFNNKKKLIKINNISDYITEKIKKNI